MAKHNNKGRARHGPSFIQLYHYMVDSKAWHELSLPARCAYLELARVYNGTNNGTIGMSVRELADRMPCNKDTAGRCLAELEDAGFIDAVKVGRFTRKGVKPASEYRLTAHKCDVSGQAPSKKFSPGVKWEGKSVRRDGTGRSEQIGHGFGVEGSSVRRDGTEKAKSASQSVRANRTHIHLHHRGCDESRTKRADQRARAEDGGHTNGRKVPDMGKNPPTAPSGRNAGGLTDDEAAHYLHGLSEAVTDGWGTSWLRAEAPMLRKIIGQDYLSAESRKDAARILERIEERVSGQQNRNHL